MKATRLATILNVFAAWMFCLTVFEFCQPLTSLLESRRFSRSVMFDGNGIWIGFLRFDFD